MVSTIPRGRFLDGNRREGLSLPATCAGVLHVGLAEIAFACTRRFRRFLGQTLGRQAGGDILGALDFLRVALLIQLLGRGRAAHRLGASLGGFALGALLSMSQPAAWGENACRAAVGKSFYHS